jgi:hypothetical protein
MTRLGISTLLLMGLGCAGKPDEKASSRFHHLSFPIVEVLRSMPEVDNVEVLVPCPSPTVRLVHIRDWHFVDKDLLIADLKTTTKKDLSDAEADELYAKHLNDVTEITIEQERILSALIERDLTAVFAEGLTYKNLTAFRQTIDQMADIQGGIDRLKSQLAGLKAPPDAIKNQVTDMERDYRAEYLRFGASGFLAAKKLLRVLPTDDGVLFERAKPVAPDGAVRLDMAATEAWHDAIVREIMNREGTALLILGGRDLSDSVKRVGGGKVEYVRVTTKKYREIAGEK